MKKSEFKQLISELIKEQSIKKCNPCQYYRKDTETCSSGCKKLRIILRPGALCRFALELENEFDKLQSECPCYR